jgi:hypothetical protein
MGANPLPPFEGLSEGKKGGSVCTKRHFEGNLKGHIVITKRTPAQPADFKDDLVTILF